jgi:hypothetical protein
MNFRNRILLALMLVLAAAGSASTAEWAWVMSVPHALSDESVYKVRILDIDGQAQEELIRYPLGAGKHIITVQLMLDLEWEPDLSEGAPGPAVKRIEVDADPGKSYLLAGKVDADAPAESQLDQSYWEPIVYAVQ